MIFCGGKGQGRGGGQLSGVHMYVPTVNRATAELGSRVQTLTDEAPVEGGVKTEGLL